MEIEKKYKFGSTVFKIVSETAMLTDERFEAFRTDEAEDYTYEVHPQEGDYGNQCITEVERMKNIIKVYIKAELIPQINVANLFSAANTSVILPEKEQFIIHAAYIVHKGEAILFCAPSETGKSTLAKFWKEKHGVGIINEDRVIISKKEGVYYAHGCWAMGKADACRNVSAPIHAVVLLEQGPINRVNKMNAVEKFYRLVIQCAFDEKNDKHCRWITDELLELIDKVPVISYQCINDISSVDELEKYI